MTVTVPRHVSIPYIKCFYDRNENTAPIFQLCITTPAGVEHIYLPSLVIFGKLTLVGAEYRIERDEIGWFGSSDLIISAYIATRSIQYADPRTNGPKLSVWLMQEGTTELSRSFMALPRCIYETLMANDNVCIYDSLPGHDTPSPVISPMESLDVGHAFTNDLVDVTFPRVATDKFITRITVKDQRLSTGVSVQISHITPCTIMITCGTLRHTACFPFPVDGTQAEIHVSRESSWIEIVVPLSSPRNGGYSNNPFPLIKDSTGAITNWNMPSIALHVAPKLDFNQTRTEEFSRVHSHVMSMFTSEEYHQNRKSSSPISNPITAYKSSLVDIFIQIAERGQRTFEIKANTDDTESTLLLFISEVYLDDNTHSLVAHGALAAIVSREIRTMIFDYIAVCTSSIVVGAAGMQAWRAALPAMVERGRTWNHNADCEYTDGVMMRTGDETVCSCSPESSRYTELFRFGGLPASTKFPFIPIVISPVFAVAYLDKTMELNDANSVRADASGGQGGEGANSKQACWKCGKEGKLKVCVKCKKAQYCSRDCQTSDWKKHKEKCGKPSKTQPSTAPFRR